ncbi:glycosyl transferase [Roseofilum sp. BLCC_M154]|uniref:Glycosyl transferase n=1 Tax=Roseofilum acuticapitatum BLCC-M154 TaxID=3022444 RepID=A0ABT7AUZ6_9CYAN|nr:hypothetical protein [Roseofilum acuticapitatum]MDJ1170731.1 glycosyl transferase [Roseofilum acuticapitatum BLCC-M154]
MSRPTVYLAITNHGFGHAVRMASVAAAIAQQNPEILLILVTTAPRWLLESYLPVDFIHRPRGFDIGVIQSDSLTMDKEATLEKLQHIRKNERSIIAGEVNFIRQNRVDLVLADLPSLAVDIAHSAGIPCWMMGNFGWDFIYRPWGGEFMEIADWISTAYGRCDRLFRLPLHEPMSAFSDVIDVGLTGGIPRWTPEQLRQQLPISAPQERTILLTFGGLSLQEIPYDTLKKFPNWQFITFDRQAPDLPNLLQVRGHEYRPVDFMPICDRIISKPGYSTFAEALRLNTPIASLTRQGFAEASVLIEGLQDYGTHQIIEPEAFFSGDWSFLHQTPNPPRKDVVLDKNGSEAIGQAVINYFGINT